MARTTNTKIKTDATHSLSEVQNVPSSLHQQPLPSVTKETLHKALSELKIVEQDILDANLAESTKKNLSLEQVLYTNDVFDETTLGRIIADLVGLPYINLSEVVIPELVLQIIPEKVAAEQLTIAYNKTDKGLFVATANPENKTLIDFLAIKTNLPIQVYYSTSISINKALALYKKNITKAYDQIIASSLEKINDQEDTEPPIISIVDTIIEYAYTSSASDIHIEPLEKETLIRFRIDGFLHDILQLPSNLNPLILTRVKVMANLRTDEHQAAQDGKLIFPTSDGDLDVRVSIAPITRGEKIVMRLLSDKARQFSLEDLGLSATDLQKVEAAYHKPHGLILATGPTGSGKTTTLYAILKLINKRDINIMTIEDPVEYQIDNVNQIQVNPATELTFAKGLRSIVRQDPDIILVGEVRDDETADIAINSAMTGHLVLSTLHTNDAVISFLRLIDLHVEPYLVASTVNLIIAQRLVRKICTKCKVSFEVPIDTLDPQITHHLGKDPTLQTYKGKGCPVCNQTGYVGRVGIFEVLEMNEELNAAIVSKKDVDDIKKIALKSGMKTMMQDGIEKVKQGITTIAELIRVTSN